MHTCNFKKINICIYFISNRLKIVCSITDSVLLNVYHHMSSYVCWFTQCCYMLIKFLLVNKYLRLIKSCQIPVTSNIFQLYKRACIQTHEGQASWMDKMHNSMFWLITTQHISILFLFSILIHLVLISQYSHFWDMVFVLYEAHTEKT